MRQGRYFFLVLAVACLGFYGYTYLQRAFYQKYESWLFDRLPARDTELAASAVLAPVGSALPSAVPSKLSSSTSSLGRISVPRLQLSAMVREGIDEDVLKVAVGHIPATALPGQTGNVGLAGHRDTFFRR